MAEVTDLRAGTGRKRPAAGYQIQNWRKCPVWIRSMPAEINRHDRSAPLDHSEMLARGCLQATLRKTHLSLKTCNVCGVELQRHWPGLKQMPTHQPCANTSRRNGVLPSIAVSWSSGSAIAPVLSKKGPVRFIRRSHSGTHVGHRHKRAGCTCHCAMDTQPLAAAPRRQRLIATVGRSSAQSECTHPAHSEPPKWFRCASG